jgi:drug/metabolite transporter (DMT)-like permease
MSGPTGGAPGNDPIRADAGNEPVDARGRGPVARFFDVRFGSATAIYGLIVFTSFITIASDDIDDDGTPITAGGMLFDAIPALAIFYAAHVFAHTLTDHGEQGFGRAFRHALHHSSGMLYAALPTIAVLVVGSFTGMSGLDAYNVSAWVAVAVLAVLGYAAYSRRRSPILIRILGAAGTAFLGFALIIFEYALH